MLSIYEALGLVIHVEATDLPESSGTSGLSQEQVIADFLARVAGFHGAD